MSGTDFFRQPLAEMIDPRHPLAVLAARLPWAQIEAVLTPHFARQVRKGRAVTQDDFTHDQCIAATMRALGYPCRATLTAWVREALPKAHRAVVRSGGQRSYPATFKQAGIVALCTRQESTQVVADELGEYRASLGLTA